MRISYKDKPLENSVFSFSAYEVGGKATFEAELDGELIWEHECSDPPCHEQFEVPEKSGGKKLLITATDSKEQQELLFFIDDDGNVSLDSHRVSQFDTI